MTLATVDISRLDDFMERLVKPRLLQREGLPHGKCYAEHITEDAWEAINRLLSMLAHVDRAHALTHCPETERRRRAVTRECIELMCCAYEYYRWYGEGEE